MKLGIVGSRKGYDRDLFKSTIIEQTYLMGGDWEIVTGDCSTGADEMARNYFESSEARAYRLTVHRADWDTHDKAAGPIRNQKIINDADELVAFLVEGEECRGTWSSIRLALKKGIPVHIYTQVKE